jgi:hypothetical protein
MIIQHITRFIAALYNNSQCMEHGAEIIWQGNDIYLHFSVCCKASASARRASRDVVVHPLRHRAFSRPFTGAGKWDSATALAVTLSLSLTLSPSRLPPPFSLHGTQRLKRPVAPAPCTVQGPGLAVVELPEALLAVALLAVALLAVALLAVALLAVALLAVALLAVTMLAVALLPAVPLTAVHARRRHI